MLLARYGAHFRHYYYEFYSLSFRLVSFFMWSFDSSQTTTDLAYNCSGAHTHTHAPYEAFSIYVILAYCVRAEISNDESDFATFPNENAKHSFLKGLPLSNPLFRKCAIEREKSPFD